MQTVLTRLRTVAVAAPLMALAIAAGLLSGCSKAGDITHSISVFAVRPGQCFQAPTSVKVQLSSLTETPCTKPHTQEAYAIVAYQAPAGSTSSTNANGISLTTSYPGDDVLSSYAQGVCAQRYAGYVGIDYLDSTLFFTYLLPSARSWEQEDDRNVICFVTTTGSTLTTSVKGSKE